MPTLTTPAAPVLRPTACAICGTAAGVEVYPANFTPDALNPEVFSARRLPDRLHYRMVRCPDCGLVRSDPVADTAVLDALYVASRFTYHDEVPHLRRTYGRYLDRARRHAPGASSLLEIGCGNGFFLEEAQARGMTDVWGVEPSDAAVSAAPKPLRPRIVRDVMRPGLFPPARFDVICLFQVFDHLPDPAAVLAECFTLLRPGGVLLAFNHDIESWSARLLGERSPIIDIEHTYLYSRATMAKVFAKAGFEVAEAGAAWNSYPARYLARLLPLPRPLKRAALFTLRVTPLGGITARVPLGNLYQIARKPDGIGRTT